MHDQNLTWAYVYWYNKYIQINLLFNKLCHTRCKLLTVAAINKWLSIY